MCSMQPTGTKDIIADHVIRYRLGTIRINRYECHVLALSEGI